MSSLKGWQLTSEAERFMSVMGWCELGATSRTSEGSRVGRRTRLAERERCGPTTERRRTAVSLMRQQALP